MKKTILVLSVIAFNRLGLLRRGKNWWNGWREGILGNKFLYI